MKKKLINLTIGILLLKFTCYSNGTIGLRLINNIEHKKFIYVGQPILNHTNTMFNDEYFLINNYVKFNIVTNVLTSIPIGFENSAENFIVPFQPNDSLEFEYDLITNKFKCISKDCEDINEFISIKKKYNLELFDQYKGFSKENSNSMTLLESYYKKVKELDKEIVCKNRTIKNHLMLELKLLILNSLHMYFWELESGRKAIQEICKIDCSPNNINTTTSNIHYYLVYYTSQDNFSPQYKYVPYLKYVSYILAEPNKDILSYYIQYYFYMDVKTNHFESVGMDPCKAFNEIIPYIQNSNVDLSTILRPYFDKDKCK